MFVSKQVHFLRRDTMNNAFAFLVCLINDVCNCISSERLTHLENVAYEFIIAQNIF